MNQEKIGNFIAQCRKEKKLTQTQLAEKLNISNKAISKWETGRGMPDSSIMLELSKYLGITVNELLSGEHLQKEDYESKVNENIIYMAKENEKNKKRTKIMITIFVSIFIFFILFIVAKSIYNSVEIALEYDNRLIECKIIDEEIVCNFKGSSLIGFSHKEINTDSETIVFFTGKMLLQNKIHSHFETWDSMAQLSDNKDVNFSSSVRLNIKEDIKNYKSKIKVYYTTMSFDNIDNINLNEAIEHSELMCEN